MKQQKQPSSNSSGFRSGNGKTVAILCYLGLIGWLLAYVLHLNKRTFLGAYHLRQTIALFILAIALWVGQMLMIPVHTTSWITIVLTLLVRFALLFCWIIGFTGAVKGKKRPMPLIGEKAQQLFR
jgi:uncharacterized membrane protein